MDLLEIETEDRGQNLCYTSILNGFSGGGEIGDTIR